VQSSYRKFGKHVVRFGDGRYMGVLGTGSGQVARVERQWLAQRLLTWACAKMMADCFPKEQGARAVKLVPAGVPAGGRRGS
jgi:hypothetical protein